MSDVQQGTLAPRVLPRFTATTDPSATVSSSVDFTVSPLIQPTWLHRFLDGTRTTSPVARYALLTVLPLAPRRSGLPLQSACDKSMLPSPGDSGLGLQNSIFSRPPLGSLTLRPGDSLTILKMAVSIGFISFVSSTNAIQATGF